MVTEEPIYIREYLSGKITLLKKREKRKKRKKKKVAKSQAVPKWKSC